MEGSREQEKGHQPPVHSLGSVGQGTGKGKLLPCTAVSTAQLREALGAEGCEMQPPPAGSSE